MAKRIGMIYCERIQDASCIGCAKCFKAVNENTFVFEDQGDVRIVFKTSCGDCPGLVVPRVDLQMTVLESLGVEVDEIYFGTCVNKATALMSCPMNVEGVTSVLEEKFGVPVHMGTHDY
ncbi:MAG: CGGC domain-containing protein [Acidobacteria bacterium]|nr:CGGC domain-containing protein [Acidobacteriota bacterium]